MDYANIILFIFFFCLYVVLPLMMIHWAINCLTRRRKLRRECEGSWRKAQQALEARLSNLLLEGLALDANVWLLSDSEDIAGVFFDLLFRTARQTAPVLLPVSTVAAVPASANVSLGMARLEKFRRCGLLITHKDGVALKPENCQVIIQVTVDGNDLFHRRIDYHHLTEELAESYRNLLKANIR